MIDIDHKNNRILVVDDQDENIKMIGTVLRESGFRISVAKSGKQALNVIDKDRPDLILLDVMMPEMDGFEVCRQLKNHPVLKEIPIIFLTGLADTLNKVQGLRLGAVDYITKPIEPEELLARINTHLTTIILYRQLEEANAGLEEKIQMRTKELAEMNEALRVSEERYRTLNENVPVAVFRTSGDGKMLSVNPAAAKMFGYDSGDEMLCSSIRDLFYYPDREDCLTRQVEKEGKIEAHETRMKRRDGSPFWGSVSAIKVADSDGTLIHMDGIIQDINQRRLAEQEKSILQDQLRQAQKMEALGTLAGGIAHDFNNILGAMLGFTQIAMYETRGQDRLKNQLDQVMAAGERAKDLVNHILSFSRQTSAEVKPVLIVPIVKEALKLLRASLPATIEINQEFNSLEAAVLADPTEIHQILMNLCTNAGQAMGDQGGTLTIKLEEVKITPQDAHLNLDVIPGKYLCIGVGDTGGGIDPAIKDRIFDPYFTTKEIGQGTGLGLALVHGIVKGYGGAIHVYSEFGKGSVFNVYLPLKKETITIPSKPDTPLFFGSERIMLVDDEDSLVRMGRDMLEQLGYKVETWTNSLEALEAFRSRSQRFDLVITDQTMPHLTGLKLSTELLKIRPDIPIIICTGFSAALTPENVQAAGISAVLMKPILIGQLARTIRQAIENEAVVSA